MDIDDRDIQPLDPPQLVAAHAYTIPIANHIADV